MIFFSYLCAQIIRTMDIRLFFDKVKLALQKRSGVTQTKKDYDWWKAKGYDNEPEVSFVLQSHNKSLQIIHVVRKLRQYSGRKEIIVIDDGSSFEHTERLVKELNGANEFLIRSNDLFEVVTYDKAGRFSNGRFVALMQDDDDFDDLKWVDDALAYFKQYPKLAILGGKWQTRATFDDDKKRYFSERTDTEKPFAFAQVICRAPMWINRTLFDEYLHHNDFRFAPVQNDDDEICLRCWTLGLQVGWYDAHFHSLSAGGMRLWNRSLTESQMERNGKLLYNLYSDKIDDINRRIDEANKAL